MNNTIPATSPLSDRSRNQVISLLKARLSIEGLKADGWSYWNGFSMRDMTCAIFDNETSGMVLGLQIIGNLETADPAKDLFPCCASINNDIMKPPRQFKSIRETLDALSLKSAI